MVIGKEGTILSLQIARLIKEGRRIRIQSDSASAVREFVKTVNDSLEGGELCNSWGTSGRHAPETRS